MGNTVIVLLLGITLFSCEDNNFDDFPGKQFEYVIAYKMNGHYGLVVENDKVSSKTIGPGERLLHKEEIELLNILNDPESAGEIGAMCFEPHIGYVFYDNQEQIVAHVTICILCSQVKSQPQMDWWLLGSKGSVRLEILEDRIFKD